MSAAPSLPPDHEAGDPYLTPPPVGRLWTSGLEGDKKKKDFLFICMNKLEWIYTYLSMNLFMRAQWKSHLSSRLWRSAANHWLGRFHSCLDLHWLSPGSDSSDTSSPHPPWYNKTPMGLTFFFEVALALLNGCDYDTKYLKHQRRSGVPSQFFPTVTISPALKDLRRQTGKERSMSKMVVAHCEWINHISFKPLREQKHICLLSSCKI